jgi:predicted HTH transcriptional regulator
VKSLILAAIQLIYGWIGKNKQGIFYLSQIDRQEIIISITDWKKFTEFASENGDKTQEQMAQLWEGDISKRTISRALEKIGFTG